MARQEGIIKLKGQIGDLAFYKTRDGYQARTKGGVSADRIANDPRFQRTRENGAEFGRAAKAGKLFRTAFKTLTSQLADKLISNRLSKQMLKVVQADTVNERGMRMVLDAETEMLAGFEFNVNGIVSTTVNMPYSTTIDRFKGLDQYITTVHDGSLFTMEITFANGYEKGDFPSKLKDQLSTKVMDWGGVDWDISGAGRAFSSVVSNQLPSFGIRLKGYNYDELEQQAKLIDSKLQTEKRVQNVNLDKDLSTIDDLDWNMLWKLT